MRTAFLLGWIPYFALVLLSLGLLVGNVHGEDTMESYPAEEEEEENDGEMYNAEEEYVYDPLQEPPINPCRRNPTWMGLDYEECANLAGWEPRSYWWEEDEYPVETHLPDGKDQEIQQCIQAAHQSVVRATLNETDSWVACNESDRTAACEVPETMVSAHYLHVEEGEIVTVRDALSEQEAFYLRALATCIQELLPAEEPFYQVRPFGDEEGENYGLYNKDGGNLCTFTQGMLQLFLPGVAASIQRAVRAAYDYAGWENAGYPHPDQLGVRTAEYLEYKRTGLLGRHTDGGSVFSISIAMSDEDEYNGGNFHLESEQAMFKVPRRSAIVFFSESSHGISQVLNGDRQVYVIELWENDDVPLGEPRPGHGSFGEYKDARLAAMGEEVEEEEEEDESSPDGEGTSPEASSHDGEL